MIFHTDIEQGTLEWHQIRYRKVGGTLSKGLFVKSDNLLIELLSEFTEDFDLVDDYVSDGMLRGSELEPEAVYQAGLKLGVEFISCGWIQSDISILGMSPDGITKDFKQQIEVKCPGAKKHVSTCLKNDIPIDNIHQCIHAFTVNPSLEKLHFASYRPENIKPLFIKTIDKQSMVNIGTEAKPLMKTVEECVNIARQSAIELQDKITKTLTNFNF